MEQCSGRDSNHGVFPDFLKITQYVFPVIDPLVMGELYIMGRGKHQRYSGKIIQIFKMVVYQIMVGFVIFVIIIIYICICFDHKPGILLYYRENKDGIVQVIDI